MALLRNDTRIFFLSVQRCLSPPDVFRVAKPHGIFLALLGTYGVSALLHGLNFQLAAVLLSLGFYTYTEHVTRRKLASIFNACIQARKCPANCGHSWKENDWIVKLSNAGFGLLAMFHLAYLGLMFDSSKLQEEGYSYYHVLSKWRWLNFSSHWITLATFVFYSLIWREKKKKMVESSFEYHSLYPLAFVDFLFSLIPRYSVLLIISWPEQYWFFHF